MPPDVKEHVIRRGWKMLSKTKNIQPEVQKELSVTELTAALTAAPGELSGEFRDELIADGFDRLRQIPLEHCAACGRPVFTHEGVKIDHKFYCETCGGKSHSQ